MRTLRTEKLPLASSDDVVAVRQAVRMQAQGLGFSLVDQTKLVTAASEIARNTVLYGGGGIVEIEVLENAPRRGVRLTFEDHGPGIAPTDLPHVFDRFYRGSDARDRPGSGLGLAIVRQVAEAHGGSVAAEAAVGGGACLRLQLPDNKVV